MPINKIPSHNKNANEYYFSDEALERLEEVLANKDPELTKNVLDLVSKIKKGVEWVQFSQEGRLQELSQRHELVMMQKKFDALKKKAGKMSPNELTEFARLPKVIEKKLTELALEEVPGALSDNENKELQTLRTQKGKLNNLSFKNLEKWKSNQVGLSKELKELSQKDVDIATFFDEEMQQKKLNKEEKKQEREGLQEFVNTIFTAGSKAHALLYKGVDEYKESRKAKIIKYCNRAGIKDPSLALKNPNFFRDELNLILNSKANQLLASGKPIEGNGQVANLKKLLGETIFKLYKLARKEERYDENYINECIKEAAVELKSATRPVIPLLGPSGGGKSTIRKHPEFQRTMLEILSLQNDKEEADYSAHSMVIDGGIERDKSSVRNNMIVFTQMHGFKDAKGIDPLDGKLKKQLLAATAKTEHVGLILVTTASKYTKGVTSGKVIDSANELNIIKELAKDPKSSLIPVNMVAKNNDMNDFIDSVQTGADLRSQSIKIHFDMLNNYLDELKEIDKYMEGTLTYEALLEKFPKLKNCTGNNNKEKVRALAKLSFEELLDRLPELKEYIPKNFMDGYIGSAKFAEAIRSFTPDNSILHVYRELVYMRLDDSGKLVKSDALDANGNPIAQLTSKRVAKAWNATIKTGIDTILKTCSETTKPENTRGYVQITANSKGTWVEAENTTNTRWVKQELFSAYKEEKIAPLHKAYVQKYSIPLIHTSGEFDLYAIQQKFEESQALDRSGKILKAIQAFNLAREPIEERPRINMAKEYPHKIDALEKALNQSLLSKNSSDHKAITDCIKQLKKEIIYRIKASADKEIQQNERLFYTAQNTWGVIETRVKTIEQSQKDLETQQTMQNVIKDTSSKGTSIRRTDAEKIVFKGEVINENQLIVSEGKLGNGTVYLEQDHRGKVVDKSFGFDEKNPQDHEHLQKIALSEAQTCLNNLRPGEKIFIESDDTQKGARLYAAVLYLVQKDPEIKKRMLCSSSWLPTYSPDKLITHKIPHFIAPTTLSQSFLKEHLPITRDKNLKKLVEQEIQVLSNQKRETIQDDVIKATTQPIDVVETGNINKQKNYKARFRQHAEETDDNKLKPSSP